MKTPTIIDPCDAPRRVYAEARAARIKAEEVLQSSEAHRSTLVTRLAEAKRDLRQASEQVADGTLSAGDQSLAEHAASVGALEAQLKALDEHALTACRSRVSAALSAEEAAAAELKRWEVYAPAQKAAESAERALREDYPKLARLFAELAHGVLSAKAAISSANKQLPAGCSPIGDPEDLVRDSPELPFETIDVKEEGKWLYESTLQKFPTEKVKDIRLRSSDRGSYHIDGYLSKTTDVVRKDFRVTRFYPARPVIRGPRIAELNIPGLKAGEQHFLAGGAVQPPPIGARQVAVSEKPLFDGPEGMIWARGTWQYR